MRYNLLAFTDTNSVICKIIVGAALAPAFKRGLSPQVTGGVRSLRLPLRAATSLTSAGGKGCTEKEKDIL